MSSCLRTPVSTTRHVRVGPTRNRPTSSSGRCVAERPMRWTSRPAARARRSSVTAEVRSPLARGDRVDLIDDHPPRALEQRLRTARKHQVQRLGGCDQDVGRLAEHRLPLFLRRVPRADADVQLGPDSAQRCSQVAFDVVRECLQRRDVDESDLPVRRLSRQPVDRPQERRQRLPRSGRCRDQHVVSRGDCGPRLGLCGSRLRECFGEPSPGAWTEGCERIGHGSEPSVAGRYSGSALMNATASPSPADSRRVAIRRPD